MEAASSIELRDKRDANAYMLSSHLYLVLRREGRVDEAREIVEEVLARFHERGEARLWLLAVAADEARITGSWSVAWERLEEAEGIAHSLSIAELDRMLAGTRCQLEIACGLLEQAAISLAAERAAVEAGATSPASRLSLLLDEAGIAMAAMQVDLLRAALESIEERLADEAEGYDDRPADRAQVRARRAMLASLLEELEPVEELRAPALLAESFQDPALDPDHRAAMGLQLIHSARVAGDYAEAARWIDRVRAMGPLQTELDGALVANRALLALATRAQEEDLR
jgi:hypothetical protein